MACNYREKGNSKRLFAAKDLSGVIRSASLAVNAGSKETVAAKAGELNGYVDQLSNLLVKAIDEHMPLHEVEEQTFRVLLKLGRETLQLLFDLLGPGDVGESYTLPNGRTVERLEAAFPPVPVHFRRV